MSQLDPLIILIFLQICAKSAPQPIFSALLLFMAKKTSRTRRFDRINQLLLQYPNLDQGVYKMAKSTAAYDTASPLRHVGFAIIASKKPVRQKKTAESLRSH
jgi:hypothetical protein